MLRDLVPAAAAVGAMALAVTFVVGGTTAGVRQTVAPSAAVSAPLDPATAGGPIQVQVRVPASARRPRGAPTPPSAADLLTGALGTPGRAAGARAARASADAPSGLLASVAPAPVPALESMPRPPAALPPAPTLPPASATVSTATGARPVRDKAKAKPSKPGGEPGVGGKPAEPTEQPAATSDEKLDAKGDEKPDT
jgi:hypothetical protein